VVTSQKHLNLANALLRYHRFFGALAYSQKAPISFVMLSVRLSAFIIAAPTGRISVKFDIGDYYENVSIKSKFG
jgi:hypothetical protein